MPFRFALSRLKLVICCRRTPFLEPFVPPAFLPRPPFSRLLNPQGFAIALHAGGAVDAPAEMRKPTGGTLSAKEAGGGLADHINDLTDPINDVSGTEQ
jgi:hypothetical protein